MKIVHFKKGDDIPEWLISCKTSGIRLIFDCDVALSKNGMRIDVWPEKEGNISFVFIKDNRNWLKKFIHRVTRKNHKLVYSRPTQFYDSPLDYARIGGK